MSLLLVLSLSIGLFSPAPTQAEETKPKASAAPSPAAGELDNSRREEAVRLLQMASTAGFAIKEEGEQMNALRRLAVAQAQAAEADAYRATLQKIKAIADRWNKKATEEWQKGDILARISYTEVKAGDLVSARKTADAINDLEKRNKALAEIGIVQAKAGNSRAALATADAIHNSKTFIDNYTKASVIKAVAVAQAWDGDREDSWKTLATISDFEARVWAFGALAVAQAKSGDLEGALATIDRIPVKTSRGRDAQTEGLKALSAAQAKAGRFDAALTTAAKISDPHEKEKALIEIGKLQAAKGDLAAAAATAGQISKGDDRDAVNVEIIRAKARARDFTGALAAASDISYDSTKAKALTAIAVAQCEAGEFDAAMATLEPLHSDQAAYAFSELALAEHQKDPALALKAMRKATFGVSTSGSLRKEEDSYLYYLLVRTNALLGEFDSAKLYVEDIADSDTKGDACQFIASELAAAKGFAEAAQWSEKLDDPYARSVAFTALGAQRLEPDRPPRDQK
jgi:hypothetical protein